MNFGVKVSIAVKRLFVLCFKPLDNVGIPLFLSSKCQLQQELEYGESNITPGLRHISHLSINQTKTGDGYIDAIQHKQTSQQVYLLMYPRADGSNSLRIIFGDTEI